MKGFSRLGFLAALAMVPPGAALGQALPEGWYLQEEDMGGVIDMTLAWYEKGSGDVKVAFHCQKGFGDVVLTIYVDGPTADGAPVAVVLEGDGTRFAFESPVGDYNGFPLKPLPALGRS
jgi:hypothetical protein